MIRIIIIIILSVPAFTIFKLKAQPPKSWSSSEILLNLKKLNTVGSVLYIAAHPDDENTRLIAYLANEKCLRTGYLSLTRGDGGQNLIGAEQGVELGLIRTQELLAARRIDGGEQFFTRAYDFGFSKTPEETFEKWNKDSILSDVVWVIRNFRPDIIITRFATDGSGGHGHHTASAILAEEAFDAAADSTRFPEQLKYVKVWKTRRLFYNTTARFRNPTADMSKFMKLDVGGYNTLLGKSYGEIAAESRSNHKSQGFGSARQRGEFLEHFKPVKGDTANLKGIFDRMDFTWKRVKGGENIGRLCEEAIKKFKMDSPGDIAPGLSRMYKELWYINQTRQEHEDKKNLCATLILACYGVSVDVTIPKNQTTGGANAKLSYSGINRSKHLVEMGYAITVADRFGFKDSTILTVLKPNQLYSDTFKQYRFTNSTQPYWLTSMPSGLFHINDEYRIGLAEYHAENKFILTFKINNSSFDLLFPIQYRWVDPEKGELYRPLVITPPVMPSMENEVVTFTDNNPKEIKVKVKAGKDSLKTKIHLDLPGYWKIEPEFLDVSIIKKNDEQTVVFKVTPPINSHEATAKVIAEVDGKSYSKSIREIKYDHIPIQTWFPEAEAKMIRLDIVRSKKRIGYIPGAGDEVQTCLAQVGYEITTITDDMLANGNLNVYDVIITGVRAYNTNELLTSKKQKLMEYVNNGGKLIVQYNTNSFVGPFKGDIGPKPFKITRERVTDENAKINFDLSNHPVLNTPNKITQQDFEGWIQERGIYFAGEIDSAYACPLSMNDKGEKPNKGSLIIADHGKGKFIYTGLVFFRELPAGVPGAYRLMVNLIEL